VALTETINCMVYRAAPPRHQMTGTTMAMRKRLQVNHLVDKGPVPLFGTFLFPKLRTTYVPILWSEVVRTPRGVSPS
jgi:hypothetical protein